MNDQEIFTPEERDENTRQKHDLIELVASGEAILLVGAGSSVRVGYPDWWSLIEKLEDLACKCGGFNPEKENYKNGDSLEYLTYAGKIKFHICKQNGNLSKYYDLLYEEFKPKSHSVDDFHQRLVSLPWRGILTTNYDIVLEAALGAIKPLYASDNSLVIDDQSAGRVHEFLMAMNNDKQIPKRIAHLHGKFDPVNSIILDDVDYRQAYGIEVVKETPELKYNLKISDLKFYGGNPAQIDSKWTLHRKLLWSVLATRRVVFVGFSLDDPYFEKMLETVSKDLWRWDKSIHFAIMSISPDSVLGSKDKAERLKREYGIETVFYENLDGKHLSLDHFIADIAQECNVEIQPAIASQDELGGNALSEDEKPKPATSSSQGVLDWLEKVNKRMEEGISDDEN